MFEKFPSIEQYRHVVKELSEHSQFVSKDADGNAIYDHTKPLPEVSFTQTVKIHGTNGGVILFKDGTIRTQSRNRVLDPVNDNNGFDKWIAKRSKYWQGTSQELFGMCPTADKIIVYGEFAGENIQRNVAVAQTPKSFYVFYAAAFFADTETCLPIHVFSLPVSNENNIYSIYQFPFKEILIDLNSPDDYVEQLQSEALSVENECPVGLFHGISGIGEGIVLTTIFDNKIFRFKVKGEKHSASKVKLSPTVDSVMIKDVREFVEQVVTTNRLEQGLQYLQEMNIPIHIKSTGDFLKWVMQDVNKEESDIIEAKGFEKKLVNQTVAKKAKQFFLAKV